MLVTELMFSMELSLQGALDRRTGLSLSDIHGLELVERQERPAVVIGIAY
jgi:hypothetical protein